MGEKNIEAPKGMIEAASQVIYSADPIENLKSVIAAALCWQRKYAPLPDDKIMGAMVIHVAKEVGQEKWEKLTEWDRARFICEEWVKRMYDAPDPEFGICPQCGCDTLKRDVPMSHTSSSGKLMPGHKGPEEIKDLLLPNIESGFFKPEIVNDRLAEAFRRGQQSR